MSKKNSKKDAAPEETKENPSKAAASDEVTGSIR